MKSTTATQTLFQIAQAQVAAGKLDAPSVSHGGKAIDYFGWQISVHHMNLKIMAAGMTVRNMKLKDLKAYYGLKGRTAADCLPQFVTVINEYRASKGMEPLAEKK